MRRQHELKPTTGTDRPQSVVFVDTETTQIDRGNGVIQHVLRLGYAVHCRSRRGEYLRVQSSIVFRSIDEFWAWFDAICKPKSKVYLVSHNLNFDMPVLDAFMVMPSLDYELDQIYTKGTTSIIRWRKPARDNDGQKVIIKATGDKVKYKYITHVIMLDNGNFFTGKLAKWGDILDLPKLSIDFNATSEAELIVYCKRDVEIMRRLWITWLDFLDRNDCGSFRYTVSSTAFSTYRASFMPERIFIHNHKQALALERNSYHGGRTECFYKGSLDNDTFYYLDFNSMYGFVMANSAFPYSLSGYTNKTSLTALDYRLESFAVIADVLLDTTEPAYGLIHDKRLIFPVGRFRTTLSTPELINALQTDSIVKVYSMAWYKSAPLFHDYVTRFYALRQHYKQAGNAGFEMICKLLVNSLYGKFGQRGINQRVIGECSPYEIKSETVFDIKENTQYELLYLGGSIIETHNEGESYHSYPAIASHVTAYARMHLWSHIKSVPRHHVYYCDTDSMIVDTVGYEALKNIISPTVLGALKIELQSDWLEINAPKDYSMEGRTRIKGITVSAEKLIENVYSQYQWQRLRGMIQAGDMTNYTMKLITKHLERSIKSGTVAPDGWIIPFRFPLS
jgi:hypothetical protein